MDVLNVQPVRILGRYALYGEIAMGGMASVHFGRLVGPVGFARTVAIKRLHPQLANDPEFASMFLDEARLAARVRHPHVVPTLDVVSSEGELFLVMEYVQGESLARLVRAARETRTQIPISIVASIMAGVLHGLHAAHEATNEQGEPLCIVHRDVSPQNVIVGVDGVARVLDFGVAKAAGRAQTTRAGQLKGKLAYMAPEQVTGTTTRSTDIYSASVVLWEALTGERLYDGENEAVVINKVLKGVVESPSRHVRFLPPVLEALVMRGLEREPSKRFETSREMARALEKAVTLAPASDVGEYVEKLAAKTLAKRAGAIALIERSAINPAIGQDAAPTAPAMSGEVAVAIDSAVPRDSIQTQLSSGSFSQMTAFPAPSRTRSSALLSRIGAAGICVVLIGLGVLRYTTRAGLGGGERPTTVAAGPNAPHAATTEALPPAQVDAVPPPEPVALLPVAVTDTPPDTPTSAPKPIATYATPDPVAARTPRPSAPHATPRAADVPRAPQAPASAQPAPKADCTPPYTLDAAGFKHYKRECVK